MAENTAAPSVSGPNAYTSADAEAASKIRRSKPKVPSDFENEYEFLEHVRTLYSKDLDSDRINREESTLDARFVTGEQWDPSVKSKRELAGKPALTINRLPAYVAQLVGNRRMNDTGIKIIPDAGGSKRVAKVREGLIRNIQKLSRAQYAFDKAFEQQVIGGLGNFQVHLDYAHDDVFEQDIHIAAIPNPLAVVWDQNSVDPSGADAQHVFVVDNLDRKEFKRRYPKAEGGSWDADMERVRSTGMDTDDDVQVVSFWRMRSKERVVAMMQNGDVRDVTDLQLEEWAEEVMLDSDQLPMIREVQRKYAEMYLCSANTILAGPYVLPIKRLPVFKVTAWELFIEGDRKRWGLIRHARDPQKLHNYWRSVIAEKLIGSPKAKWIAADTAVEGYEDDYRRSHLSDDPLLKYNASSGAQPQRLDPVQMEAALIQEAGLASQDIRDVTNLHEANMGQRSNEVSGRAIMARQRVGEVGTVVYQDNLNIAIEECGKVINDLIPVVYDTPRIIKVLGEDMLTEKLVPINQQDPESVDITEGKYTVSVTTGPSYTTRRVESREEMMAMVNAMPQMMSVAADKIIEAQDWPGAEAIARRVRAQLPPGMVSEQDMDEDELQALQGQQQAAQAQQEMQQQQMQIEMALKQAQVEEAQARAQEAQARAQQAMASAAKSMADIEQNRLDGAVDAAVKLNPPAPANNGAR